MRPRVYILHGWSGHPDHGFKPWLKRELEQRGYQVTVPSLPDPDTPQMATWIPFVQQLITSPDEHTIIVGHSMGGATVLRYLESLPPGVRVGMAVLVAGVIDQITGMTDEHEQRISAPWLTTPIDWEKVRRSAREIIAFFSDNDPYIPLSGGALLQEKVGARTIIEHNMGHYSGDDGVTEVPSILAAIIA